MDGEPRPRPGRDRPARGIRDVPAHAAGGVALTKPSLTWAPDGGSAILVTDLGDDEARRRLAVVPAGALTVPGAVVPMPGRWEAEGDALRFTPRLPFVRDVDYALVEDADTGSWVELARLRRSGSGAAATATVVAVHPAAAEVPENLLRLSVTFSAPMDEGSATGAVHLVDSAGVEIPHALLPMPPELWDRGRRRLTLLLEPGRIKRGLVPNMALGAPLADRSGFALVVDATMRDAVGAPLVRGARREYRVGPPVRARVDPALWRVDWPTPGSRDVLGVRFDRPLDAALALRCLTVTGSDGRAVPGRPALGDGDVRWTFVADEPWPDGPVELRIDAALEDPAGNSVRRVFDRDLQRDADAPVEVDRVILTRAGCSGSECSARVSGSKAEGPPRTGCCSGRRAS